MENPLLSDNITQVTIGGVSLLVTSTYATAFNIELAAGNNVTFFDVFYNFGIN